MTLAFIWCHDSKNFCLPTAQNALQPLITVVCVYNPTCWASTQHFLAHTPMAEAAMQGANMLVMLSHSHTLTHWWNTHLFHRNLGFRRTTGWSNRRFHLVGDSCPTMSLKEAQNKRERCILDCNLTDAGFLWLKLILRSKQNIYEHTFFSNYPWRDRDRYGWDQW